MRAPALLLFTSNLAVVFAGRPHPSDSRGSVYAGDLIEAAKNSPESNLDPNPKEKRACWYGDKYGCSDGYCYRVCGEKDDGNWCWVAIGGGNGPWLRCTIRNQCAPDAVPAVSLGCGTGECDACGCSCS